MNGTAFHNLLRADPYRAMAHDRLHANNSGLGGDHLNNEVISRLTNLDASLPPQDKCYTHFATVQ